MKVDIAVFMPSFGSGGAERMTINLCRGLSEANKKVDLVVRSGDIPFKQMLNRHIRIVRLKGNKKNIVSQLINYLRENTPKVLLSTKGGDREAIEAKYKGNMDVKVVLRHGTTFSKRDKDRFFLKRIILRYKLKRTLPKADLIIAVSNGVAEDIIRLTNIQEKKVKILPNPTIVPEIFELAKQEVDHPWFREKKYPIILGAGGFRRAKDFPTLIKAFGIVRSHLQARLVILGDGRQRTKVEDLIKGLGLSNEVWLPGFRENPYSFMRSADLFVLSSIWEGSPNVLIESMALGTPVVSTDCPSGPREILANGKYGKLVPMQCPKEMATAILHSLRTPMRREIIQQGVKRFELKNSIQAYIEALEL